MSALIASALPTFVDASGGQSVAVEVSIANTSSLIDAFEVKVFGLDPAWVELPPALSLFPGDLGAVIVNLHLPEGFPAGMRSITFHVRSENDHEAFALATIALSVAGAPKMAVRVDPVTITGGRRAQFGMVVANQGNGALSVAPSAVDAEEKATFEFTPRDPTHLLPGEQVAVQARVTARRPWVGAPKVRVLSFVGTAVDPAGAPTGKVESIGTFIQRPRIGRWLLSLLGLITAAGVFAIVLRSTVNNVVDEASVSDALVNEALAKGQPESPTVSLKPARVSGLVLSSTTGTGVAGVQAEVFGAGDGTTPVASGATAADGTYAFGRLGKGTYRIKFSGAGFGVLWYPDGRVFTEGKDVPVADGGTVALDPVTFAGLPATVSGKVIAEGSPTGAKISLVRTGVADPDVPAVAATTDVSADGSFVLADVPSPGDYELIADKPGADTERRAVVVAPGQQIEGIEVNLRPSGGVISGTVFAGGQPAGGVDVSATDGTTTIATVSLTKDAVGTYALRNLPSPGLYTVTVSKAGFQSQTRTVTLDVGVAPAPVDFSLVPAVGSIAGTVTGPDRAALGGVEVHLTGGEIDLTATTVSQGQGAGTYSFGQLPVPGTYTVTFTKTGFVDQVRLAPIDPATGPADVGNIDASLGPSGAQITGTVVDDSGAPVPRATVKLTDGATTRTLLSADEPPGGFTFGAVVPGSYTVTASSVGAADVVQIVTVRPGQPVDLVLPLGRRASLSGLVRNANGAPAAGVVVRLFAPAQFPRGTSTTFVLTDANGRYTFTEVAAPADFVVAAYLDTTTTEALDSEQVVSVPGNDVAVGDLVTG